MTNPALAEVYADPEISYSARHWTDVYSRSVDGLLDDIGHLGHITTRAALASQLEELDPYARSRESAAMLLGSLPASMLIERYGIEITAWTIGNDPESMRSERVAKGLEAEGFDPELLDLARRLSQQRDINPTGRDVLAHFHLLEELVGGGLQKLDLPAALQASVKEAVGSPLSEKRLGNYALILMKADSGGYSTRGRVHDWEGRDEVEKPGLQYDMYLDTPMGFALTYKGVPQAMAGLTANGPDELFIRQMQGIRGTEYNVDDREITGYKSARGLAPLDWQHTAVHLTSQLARHMGVGSVSIIAGSKVPNPYYNYLTLEQARQAYDAPALRLGFAPDADGNWHKPVEEILA
jgi:hypothetical protein